jgi:hypothetical protein
MDELNVAGIGGWNNLCKAAAQSLDSSVYTIIGHEII